MYANADGFNQEKQEEGEKRTNNSRSFSASRNKG